MTQNTIAHARLMEDVRSHQEQERLKARELEILARQAGASERGADAQMLTAQANVSNAETNRYNAETNKQNSILRGYELEETKRHNLVWEEETQRSNLMQESLRSSELDEAVRSHLANETLTAQKLYEEQRSNRAKEEQARRELSIQAAYNFDTIQMRKEENKQRQREMLVKDREVDMREQSNKIDAMRLYSESVLGGSRIISGLLSPIIGLAR